MDIFLLINRKLVLLLTLLFVSCIPNQDIYIEPTQIFGDEYKLIETIELDWPYTWVQDIYLMNDSILVNASLRKPFQFVDKWFAYDINTRQEIWSVRGDVISAFYPPMVYDDQNLYSGSTHLKAINLRTGEVQWEHAVNAANSISVSETLVFLGDKYSIQIYNKASGELVFTKDMGFRPGTFYDIDRNWFSVVSDEHISIYDGTTGDLLKDYDNLLSGHNSMFSCYSEEDVTYWNGKLFCAGKYVDLEVKYLQKKEYIGGLWLSQVEDNIVFLLLDENLAAYDLSEEKILWQKAFYDNNKNGQQVFIRSKVFTLPSYGAVFTSDSNLQIFPLDDGKEISSTHLYTNRNFEGLSIKNFPNFIAANDKYVIIALEDSKLSIFEKIK
ncbi:MAG: hypothetical protein CVU39_13200 [Chloroflexi bacterium HGW-Chloroflexi-10]|nr:MAG: hypothetical protein CVU39_13200 [Chloroflexi bacterium HGW-Chloroflexi-10]